jgi:hypothetical protein
VVVMMPFFPTTSEVQGAVKGVDWEVHRYVWRWDEWLVELAGLGHRIEVVAAPPVLDTGIEPAGPNKGVTISWH